MKSRLGGQRKGGTGRLPKKAFRDFQLHPLHEGSSDVDLKVRRTIRLGIIRRIKETGGWPTSQLGEEEGKENLQSQGSSGIEVEAKTEGTRKRVIK